MAKIKICGLTRIDDILAVNRYQPDYIGFVFAKKSRRYLSPQQAAGLKKQLSAGVKAVGVFVNEEKEKIVDLLNNNIIDMAQLHGQETEEEICWMKEQTGRKVIKAISVQSEKDITRWEQSSADYLLLDNGAGGTGCTFDWNLIADCGKPYFLAGGITLGNLPKALATGAYAIDLSGGVETDGKKDAAKIAEIIQYVRTYK